MRQLIITEDSDDIRLWAPQGDPLVGTEIVRTNGDSIVGVMHVRALAPARFEQFTANLAEARQMSAHIAITAAISCLADRLHALSLDPQQSAAATLNVVRDLMWEFFDATSQISNAAQGVEHER